MQKTLVLLKPDAVKRQLLGKVIGRFENIGLKVVGMKMVWADRDFAKKHYSHHVGKPFYPELESFIISGPVVALCIGGIESVEVVRKLVGPTDPKEALPGTIRGDYSHHSAYYNNREKKVIKNVIHASGSKEEAEEEIKLWFKEEELHNYSTVHEEHTF